LLLLVTVDSAFTVMFCRFVGWIFSLSSFSERARFLDARVDGGGGGTGHSGELDKRGAIVLVRLWYVFLTVVAMAGSVLGFKWYCGVWIVWQTPNAAQLQP